MKLNYLKYLKSQLSYKNLKNHAFVIWMAVASVLFITGMTVSVELAGYFMAAGTIWVLSLFIYWIIEAERKAYHVWLEKQEESTQK